MALDENYNTLPADDHAYFSFQAEQGVNMHPFDHSAAQVSTLPQDSHIMGFQHISDNRFDHPVSQSWPTSQEQMPTSSYDAFQAHHSVAPPPLLLQHAATLTEMPHTDTAATAGDVHPRSILHHHRPKSQIAARSGTFTKSNIPICNQSMMPLGGGFVSTSNIPISTFPTGIFPAEAPVEKGSILAAPCTDNTSSCNSTLPSTTPEPPRQLAISKGDPDLDPDSDPSQNANCNSNATLSSQSKNQGQTHQGPTRRQHRSCDQCRKGKRACDASIPPAEVTLARKSTQTPTREELDRILPRGPCSNCSKTNKICTFEWLTTQLTSLPSRRANAEGTGLRKKNKQVAKDSSRPACDDLIANSSIDPASNAVSGFAASASSASIPPSLSVPEVMMPAPTDSPALRMHNSRQSATDYNNNVSELASLAHSNAVPISIGHQPLSSSSMGNPVHATSLSSLSQICNHTDITSNVESGSTSKSALFVSGSAIYSTIPGTDMPSGTTDTFSDHQNHPGVMFLAQEPHPSSFFNVGPETLVSTQNTRSATFPISSLLPEDLSGHQNQRFNPSMSSEWQLGIEQIPDQSAVEEPACNNRGKLGYARRVSTNLNVCNGSTPVHPSNHETCVAHPGCVPNQQADALSSDVISSNGMIVARTKTQHAKDSERKRKRSNSSTQLPFLNFSISDLPNLPLGLKIFGNTNAALISQNLMRVYNDSMENALSCWLSMRTCPFKALNDWSAEEFIQEEWGPASSNRILGRVFSLDRVLSAAIKKPMAQRDDRLATRAVQLVALAFGAQWAQSSDRSRGRYGDTRTGDAGLCQGSQSFDRSLYEAIWPMARQALLDASGVESFKVVFAHLLFSMTQAPLSSLGVQNDGVDDLTAAAAEWTLDDIDDALAYEGPSIFLEHSLRTLHSLRTKLNRLEKENAVPMIGRTDRQTIGMMSWLVVMLDTVSAAIHERPVVISDEDSSTTLGITNSESATFPSTDSSPAPSMAQASSSSTFSSTSTGISDISSHDLWDDFFFAQQDLFRQSNAGPLRWPCTYEEAAAVLCDAAPVKVLLYRKITKLQTSLSREAYGEPVEMVIWEILRTCTHWNSHFDPFIRDCIAYHTSLPPRVQSWYICMVAHWYLGIIMIAELLETIDSRGYGLSKYSNFRKAHSLAARMKQDSAYAISDLARGSCPQDTRLDISSHLANVNGRNQDLSDIPGLYGGDSHPLDHHAQLRQTQRLASMSADPTSVNYSPVPLDDFHFALNEGALLTEPWTAILIRGFAKAATWMIEDFDQGGSVAPVQLPDLKLQRLIQAASYISPCKAKDSYLSGVNGSAPSSTGNPGYQSYLDGTPTDPMYSSSQSNYQFETSVHPLDEGPKMRANVPSRSILSRCEECVRALWYLGKKSDISRLTSSIIRRALDERLAKVGQQNSADGSGTQKSAHFDQIVAVSVSS